MSAWRWAVQFPLYGLTGVCVLLEQSGAVEAAIGWSGATLFALTALGAGRIANGAERSRAARDSGRYRVRELDVSSRRGKRAA
ncbi:MAG: hypothetical protein ACKVVT_03430 [Dehalococcoidia bacterium]